MRFHALWLILLLSFVGCTGHEAPPVRPEAPPIQPEALPEAGSARVAQADADPGDPQAQCEAGGAQACRTLCEAQAAVCDKDGADYDKDKCKSESEDIAFCPNDPSEMELGRLCRLKPSALSPTQGAVGMLAVTCKARSLEEKQDDKSWKLRRYLMARPVPVVLGPGEQLFLTDHHHLATGLLKSTIDEADKNLYVCPMAKRTSDEEKAFWDYMENNNFTWLHDREGRKIKPNQLPPGLAEIGDDPFRTLSRWVRDSCGYIKCGKKCGGNGADTSDLARCQACSEAPYFLEFRWADYMRDLRDQCGILDGVYGLSTEQQAQQLPSRLPCLMGLVQRQAALDLGLPGWNNGLIETKEVGLDSNGCEE